MLSYRGVLCLLSVLQDLIPETIPSEKCHTNMGLILNGYGDMSIWNTASARYGYVHRHISTPVSLQLANSADGCAVRHVITSLNCENVVYIFQSW